MRAKALPEVYALSCDLPNLDKQHSLYTHCPEVVSIRLRLQTSTILFSSKTWGLGSVPTKDVKNTVPMQFIYDCALGSQTGYSCSNTRPGYMLSAKCSRMLIHVIRSPHCCCLALTGCKEWYLILGQGFFNHRYYVSIWLLIFVFRNVN